MADVLVLNCVRQLVVAQCFDKSLVPGHVAELCSAYLPSDACEVPVSDPEPYQIAKAEGVGAEGGIAAQDATASAQMAY